MPLIFFTSLLSGLLMVGMPIALGIYLARRFRLGWRIWLIGAATFIISQVGHIPFNALVTRMFQVGVLPTPAASWRPIFNAVFLGLSAGLWEELSRAAVYRWWIWDARSWRKGVQFGAGHGGAEAIILGVLVLLNLFSMAAFRGADLSQRVPASQLALAEAQVQAFWSMPWGTTLLGAVERAFTIPLQIGLAVIVLQAFTRRQPLWVVGAILLHALVDAVTVYLSGVWADHSWGIYAIEGIVGLFALAAVVILFALRTPEPPEPAVELPPPAGPLQPPEEPAAVTPEDLERSKYL